MFMRLLSLVLEIEIEILKMFDLEEVQLSEPLKIKLK